MAESVATSEHSRSRGKRFFHIARAKRKDSPPPPVPHYSPVSPIEDDDNKARMPSGDFWPGQRSPTPGSPPTVSTVSQEHISVFDEAPEEQETEATTAHGTDETSYDLKPPPPPQHANIEALAGRLFSIDHINTILRDSVSAAKFTRFLKAYRPRYSPVLKQYAESRKAVLALEYANAVAASTGQEEAGVTAAAALDRSFQAHMNKHVDGLVNEALPAYITHRLTQLVTDTLVKEITQTGAPILRELVPNLAEVYCITDPSLRDNPIVYASQEFYSVSQYGREYVIGRNCRFLQGPKTASSTVERLIAALKSGQEVCETVLNYKRDGTPFMNLLLIAPLYDDKGQVRYFLGCQIDVSPLIERGRGLESFEQLLANDRIEARYAGALDRDPSHTLSKLGQMLSEEEVSVIRTRTPMADAAAKPSGGRRIIGADDIAPEQAMWPHRNLGPSGRLPGVYQNYLLVRPFPSLRITFTSPALRIPGLAQSKLLDRIGGNQHVRHSILDTFAHGTGFTAKVQWLTASLNSADKHNQQSRWLHATPMMGADEQIGVWMVVMVEQEEVTGSLRRPLPAMSHQESLQFGPVHSSVRSVATGSSRAGRDLYAEYLQSDLRADSAMRTEIMRDEFPDF